MRRSSFARTIAGVAVAAAMATASTRAHAGDPVAAREQVKIGYTLAQDGKCDEAIPHFVESLKLDAKAITLINLASCEEKTGKLSDALGHWVEARARAQAEGNAGIEAEAEKRVKALEPRLAKLTIVLPAGHPDAVVLRDGVALGAASMNVPLPVNPGAHALVLQAKGFTDTTQNVTVAEGESKRVALVLGEKSKVVVMTPLPPSTVSANRAESTGTPEKSGGTSPLAWAGFGVAAVGVAVGTVTGVLAFGKKSTVDEHCPGDHCDSQGMDAVDSGRTFATISTIGFIVGGVGAAVGIYALTLGKPKASTSMAVGFDGRGLRGTF